jgi:hypothetical protein
VLIIDADIDVADIDDVADILGSAIIVSFQHGGFPWRAYLLGELSWRRILGVSAKSTQ